MKFILEINLHANGLDRHTNRDIQELLSRSLNNVDSAANLRLGQEASLWFQGHYVGHWRVVSTDPNQD